LALYRVGLGLPTTRTRLHSSVHCTHSQIPNPNVKEHGANDSRSHQGCPTPGAPLRVLRHEMSTRSKSPCIGTAQTQIFAATRVTMIRTLAVRERIIRSNRSRVAESKILPKRYRRISTVCTDLAAATRASRIRLDPYARCRQITSILVLGNLSFQITLEPYRIDRDPTTLGGRKYADVSRIPR